MPDKTRLSMPPIGHDELKDWVRDNWTLIKCTTYAGGNLAFSAARAITEFEGRGNSIWNFINQGIWNGLQFAGCMAEAPHAEEHFPPETTECQCAAEGGQLFARIDAGLGAEEIRPIGSPNIAKEILETGYTADGAAYCQWKSTGYGINIESVERLDQYQAFSVDWFIQPMPMTGCCGQAPPQIPYVPEPPAVEIPSYSPTRPDEPCDVLITHIDSRIDFKGTLWNKYKVGPVPGESCMSVYDRFCYWESWDGVFILDSCGDPLPFPPHRPVIDPNPGLSQVRYSVSAGCTWNEEEQRYDTVYDAIVNETDNGILGLAWRLDAIAWLLEKVNLIPYGICGNDTKPQLAPHWRSIRFESEEPSPNGKSRLRKLLRYRGAEPGNVDFLAGYWEDFEWTTGPVCVYHKGSPVGTPQVWADSEEEGKRVLRHAFGEAGFDADQIGEWGVSGSSDPRYGVRLKVKLKVVDGCWSATARQGPNGWPEAAVALPKPYGSDSYIKQIGGTN